MFFSFKGENILDIKNLFLNYIQWWIKSLTLGDGVNFVNGEVGGGELKIIESFLFKQNKTNVIHNIFLSLK